MKWLLLCLLLAPGAAAISESEAPEVDDRILRAWHTPERPEPNTQWNGFIEFEPGHNVTSVRYQICKVGIACFAGPTPAQKMSDNLWSFDTSNYGIAGRAVEWGINDEPGDDTEWRVGVQYIIFTADDDETDPFGGELVPHGVECDSDEGRALGWVPCQETHYLAFDMDGRGPANEGSPSLPIMATIVALGLVAWRRR